MDILTFYSNAIKRYLPEYLLKFDLVHSNCLKVYISSKDDSINVSLSIPISGTTWKIVKKRIDSALETKASDRECTICEDFDRHDDNILSSCNKCGNNFCLYCYIDIMRANKGKIVCPFCRYEFGKVMPPKMIEEAVRLVLEKSRKLTT